MSHQIPTYVVPWAILLFFKMYSPTQETDVVLSTIFGVQILSLINAYFAECRDLTIFNYLN